MSVASVIGFHVDPPRRRVAILEQLKRAAPRKRPECDRKVTRFISNNPPDIIVGPGRTLGTGEERLLAKKGRPPFRRTLEIRNRDSDVVDGEEVQMTVLNVKS